MPAPRRWGCLVNLALLGRVSRTRGGEYVVIVIATTTTSLPTSARSRPTTGLAAAGARAAGPASDGGTVEFCETIDNVVNAARDILEYLNCEINVTSLSNLSVFTQNRSYTYKLNFNVQQCLDSAFSNSTHR